MNVKSVRDLTSYLSCDCVNTKYSFCFCKWHKRAPIDILRWVFQTLSQQKKEVNYVRFDEGGELARSYEVNKMLVEEFHILMQTTDGYSSHLNGITERGHRTDADSIWTYLYTAGPGDKYWCFVLLHSNHSNRSWCKFPDLVTPYAKTDQNESVLQQATHIWVNHVHAWLEGKEAWSKGSNRHFPLLWNLYGCSLLSGSPQGNHQTSTSCKDRFAWNWWQQWYSRFELVEQCKDFQAIHLPKAPLNLDTIPSPFFFHFFLHPSQRTSRT